MILAGFDVSSSKTGVAIYDTRSPLSAIITKSFAAEGDTPLEKIESFTGRMIPILKEYRPDFAAVEEPLPIIPSFKKGGSDDLGGEAPASIVVNARSSLILNVLYGSAMTALVGMKVPRESVVVETWRKAFLGYGRKRGMKRVDYKRAAKAQCDMLRIPVRNQDEADAVGIVWWLHGHSQKLKLLEMAKAA
ncbi:MAG TPA: hypothetical protein VMF90_12285 [Rhizobiaceae bacterium]|nr:hypothetical protein [Rhizobiaceae bacterium]